MNYPADKYRYFMHNTKDGGTEIIAMSTYCGKEVKGKAKCHPDDKFDLETGKKLAALRCAAKIADKRAKRAFQCSMEANEKMDKAVQHHYDMIDYLTDSINNLNAAKNELNDFIQSLIIAQN